MCWNSGHCDTVSGPVMPCTTGPCIEQTGNSHLRRPSSAGGVERQISATSQLMLRTPLLLFFCLTGSAACAAEFDTSQCTLDVEHYRKQARELARAKGGRMVDPEGFQVTWLDRRIGRITVIIGGCNHLGLSAVAERSANRMPPHAQAIACASRLVLQAWPKAHAAAAVGAFARLERSQSSPTVHAFVGYGIDGYDSIELDYSLHRSVLRVKVQVIPPI